MPSAGFTVQAGEELAARWLPGLLTEKAPTAVVDELRSILADVHPRGARTMASAMANADLRDALQHIAVPTLLLYGAADVGSPQSVAERLHADISGSTLVVLEDVGHQLNMEDADRFNATLRDFIGSRSLQRRRPDDLPRAPE